MRFVRIQAEGERPPPGLSDALSGGNLDLLQLDYPRPRLALVPQTPVVEAMEFAPGFFEAMSLVRKTLFLEPQFRVITSAGWDDAYGCVEKTAALLTEGGCGDLPISAVRGSNLLPIMDYLEGEGIRFDNADTGAPWSAFQKLRAPIVAANLQLGAGPLVTALAEGARVVVAGCYDAPSPATAAAVHAFGWEWHDWTQLAGAAAAARAAVWSPWHGAAGFSLTAGALSASRLPCVDVAADGRFTVDLGQPFGDADREELTHWMHCSWAPSPCAVQADVRCMTAKLVPTPTGATQMAFGGIAGGQPDGRWRLEVVYQAGYVAEILLEFLTGTSADVRREVAAAFTTHFGRSDIGRDVKMLELAPEAATPDSAGWLHLVCRAKAPAACREFVDESTAFIAAHPTVMRIAAGRPAVFADCSVWPTAIPRGAVDIAVDTRPAKEWA